VCRFNVLVLQFCLLETKEGNPEAEQPDGDSVQATSNCKIGTMYVPLGLVESAVRTNITKMKQKTK
jgi:hypothetical protein